MGLARDKTYHFAVELPHFPSCGGTPHPNLPPQGGKGVIRVVEMAAGASPRQLRIGDARQSAAGGEGDAENETAAAVAVDGLQRAFAPDGAAMGVGADQTDILGEQAEREI